jgi:hypothetical protein
MGDKGPPCHKPRTWQILSPGLPLMMIMVLVDDRIAETQSRHHSGKPRCSKTLMRNGHDTESKALARSILNKMHGLLCVWSSLAAACTYLKLSCMYQPFTNALCLWWINSGSLGASLMTRIFKTNLPR